MKYEKLCEWNVYTAICCTHCAWFFPFGCLCSSVTLCADPHTHTHTTMLTLRLPYKRKKMFKCRWYNCFYIIFSYYLAFLLRLAIESHLMSVSQTGGHMNFAQFFSFHLSTMVFDPKDFTLCVFACAHFCFSVCCWYYASFGNSMSLTHFYDFQFNSISKRLPNMENSRERICAKCKKVNYALRKTQKKKPTLLPVSQKKKKRKTIKM